MTATAGSHTTRHATAEAFATATTSVSAATYADLTGVTISLAAGTWLVLLTVVGEAVNTLFLMMAAITDGANTVVAEGAQGVPASGAASVNNVGTCTIAVIVAPIGTTTYKGRAARGLTTLTATWTALDGSGYNTANQATNNTDKGTSIRAFRVA